MQNEMSKENNPFDNDLPRKLEFENGADATGFWFAAAVLFAVLAAGIIVYRTANSDNHVRTATIDVPATTQADPMWPSSVLPPR